MRVAAVKRKEGAQEAVRRLATEDAQSGGGTGRKKQPPGTKPVPERPAQLHPLAAQRPRAYQLEHARGARGVKEYHPAQKENMRRHSGEIPSGQEPETRMEKGTMRRAQVGWNW